MVVPALEAAGLLEEQHGIRLTVVNARFVKPLDSGLILELAGKFDSLITIEENALQGGFGTAVLELLEEHGLSGTRVLRLGYPDSYIPQGEQHELRAMLGLDPAGICHGGPQFPFPVMTYAELKAALTVFGFSEQDQLTMAQIKRRHRELSKTNHPDLRGDGCAMQDHQYRRCSPADLPPVLPIFFCRRGILPAEPGRTPANAVRQ